MEQMVADTSREALVRAILARPTQGETFDVRCIWCDAEQHMAWHSDEKDLKIHAPDCLYVALLRERREQEIQPVQRPGLRL
jgi:hypothetical protein